MLSLALTLLVATQSPEHWVLLSSGAKVGDLKVTTTGKKVDVDWKVDNNGRGSKYQEQIELGADGTPVRWEITGNSWAGAPVKESFSVDGKRATWKSLDDEGSADAGPLYLPNNSSPYVLAMFTKVLLGAKSKAMLPGGTAKLEKVRDVRIGSRSMTAYALSGLDLQPSIVLVQNKKWMGRIEQGYLIVDAALEKDADAISKLAGELNDELLAKMSKSLMHDAKELVIIKNVRVFDALKGALSPALQTVIVYRGQIAAVRAATESVPESEASLVVDGEGGTLLPGLFDAHAHAWGWAGPLHIAAGVTSTLDPGNDNEMLLSLQPKTDRGELIGPRIERAGFLEGKSPFSARTGFVVDSVDDALAKVRWYADHGYRQIKIYNSMTPDWVKPIATEAHRLGLRVSGHVPAFMTSERAVRDGYDSINHINQLVLSWVIGEKDDTRTPFRFTALGERLGSLDLKSDKVTRMITLMKTRGTTLDPTLAIFQQMLLSRPGQTAPNDVAWLDHMPPSMQRGRRQLSLDVKPEQYAAYEASWKKLLDVMQVLHKEGIALVPGTDDQPGFMLHSELESWALAKIPNASILQSATIGTARFLGTDQRTGSITIGKHADLYLVDGDPTKDIGALRKGRFVMKGESAFFPDEIHQAFGVKPFAARAKVITRAVAAR